METLIVLFHVLYVGLVLYLASTQPVRKVQAYYSAHAYNYLAVSVLLMAAYTMYYVSIAEAFPLVNAPPILGLCFLCFIVLKAIFYKAPPKKMKQYRVMIVADNNSYPSATALLRLAGAMAMYPDRHYIFDNDLYSGDATLVHAVLVSRLRDISHSVFETRLRATPPILTAEEIAQRLQKHIQNGNTDGVQAVFYPGHIDDFRTIAPPTVFKGWIGNTPWPQLNDLIAISWGRK